MSLIELLIARCPAPAVARRRRAVADAGAAVDVIGVQHRAGELLHHIVGFVAGAARGAGGHDGARAMLLFDLLSLLAV